MKKVGNFISKNIVSPESMYLKTKEHLSTVNLREFIEECEDGLSNYDDLVVTYFEYGNKGVGSVIVFLAVYLDEFGDYFNIEYAIQKELEGRTEILEYYPLQNEKKLYQRLFDILVQTDDEFAQAV